jgi:hypothetical protein
MRHVAIRIHLEDPAYSDNPDFQYDWFKSVYGELHGVKPTDAPEPLHNFFITHYIDASHWNSSLSQQNTTGYTLQEIKYSRNSYIWF